MSAYSARVSDGELSKLVSNLKSEGINPAQATRGQISTVMLCSDRRARTLQGHLRKTSGLVTKEDYKSSVSADRNSWEISLPKTRIKTLDQLIKEFKVDTSVWIVEKFVVNKWEMGSIDKDKNPQTTELYQVKAWLKRKVEVEAIKKEIEQIKLDAKVAAKFYVPKKSIPKTGYMLEISIPDLHMGKMAWAEETGYENYDIKEAEALHDEALDTLIQRTSSFEFEQVVLVVGNDLLHADNRQGTTESGTPVDTDGRYQKYFLKARRMMTRAIERLAEIAPVHVLVVSGNHDAISAWHLGDSLECTFAKAPDVKIDNAPTFRKYHKFGKVMLMYTHGHKGKLKDYPLVMATERPDLFGSTTHREAHVGHTHQLKVQEEHGVRIRVSPALCPPDAWHSENMFIGNKRSAEALVWHAEDGLVGTAIFTAR